MNKAIRKTLLAALAAGACVGRWRTACCGQQALHDVAADACGSITPNGSALANIGGQLGVGHWGWVLCHCNHPHISERSA